MSEAAATTLRRFVFLVRYKFFWTSSPDTISAANLINFAIFAITLSVIFSCLGGIIFGTV